jgi:hypothetical protein
MVRRRGNEAAYLLCAIDFSAKKHRHQRRKGLRALPYINHPIEVATLLATVGGITDPSVLVAAVLHDTIEDTKTKAKEVEEQFGRKVRRTVEAVTDNKNLPKSERKRLQVRHAPHLSRPAKMLKIADKLSNIRDVIDEPAAGWPLIRRWEYLDFAEEVVSGCRGCNAALEAEFQRVLKQARAALASEVEGIFRIHSQGSARRAKKGESV